MADHNAEQWYPTAAYLYVLHLDDLALAWEYLRRNPEYRRDWRDRQRRPEAAQRWGLRLLEDPRLDARDAHPVWFPDPPELIHLYPDVDPMPDSVAFDFWRLPGSKGLVHDGRRLLLTTRWPGCCLRLTVAPGLEQGMAGVEGGEGLLRQVMSGEAERGGEGRRVDTRPGRREGDLEIARFGNGRRLDRRGSEPQSAERGSQRGN